MFACLRNMGIGEFWARTLYIVFRGYYNICKFTCMSLQVGVIATPDIHSFELTDREHFIILGCDGLWGVSFLALFPAMLVVATPDIHSSSVLFFGRYLQLIILL